MMTKGRQTAIIILAFCGMLFAGFLALRSMLGVTCNGGCSYLFTFPTCLYGFVFFLVLFVGSLFLSQRAGLLVVRTVSIIGMLFSLWFAIQELQPCVFCYWLGFPNCVYGFLVYTAIMILSFWQTKTKKKRT